MTNPREHCYAVLHYVDTYMVYYNGRGYHVPQLYKKQDMAERAAKNLKSRGYVDPHVVRVAVTVLNRFEETQPGVDQ